MYKLVKPQAVVSSQANHPVTTAFDSYCSDRVASTARFRDYLWHGKREKLACMRMTATLFSFTDAIFPSLFRTVCICIVEYLIGKVIFKAQ